LRGYVVVLAVKEDGKVADIRDFRHARYAAESLSPSAG
jgi:hypothetical protein